jgi:hypothetical protein
MKSGVKTKQVKGENVGTLGQRVGEVWHVVESFGRDKVDPLRDWEWEEPVPETVNDVLWSEDEESGTKVEVASVEKREEEKLNGGSGDAAVAVAVVGGGDGDGGRGCQGGGPRDAPPRGKSWMIVTDKMLKDYIL